MQKYFKEEGARIRFSSYIKLLEEDNNQDSMLREAKYLYNILGDVALTKDQLKAFHGLFHTIGGRYDVRTEPETIMGLYRISMRHPDLTKKAIDEIAHRYIDDFFKEEAIEIKLAKVIDVFGPTDDAFIVFLNYVDQRAVNYEKQYAKEAEKLDIYKDSYSGINYSFDYITYLKAVVTRKHIPVDQIIDKMPKKELIQEDTKLLLELATNPVLSLGMSFPLSYQMTKDYAKNGNLDNYDEDLMYYRSIDKKTFKAPFTKQGFIDSVRENGIRKVRKREVNKNV